MTEWTWERIEAEATPPEVSVSICVRGDLVAEHDRLDGELRRVRDEDDSENRLPRAPQVAQKIRDLEDQIRDAEVEFTFRGVGRRVLTDLETAHPATAEQQDAQEDGSKLSWNPQTYPPALVAASCVTPAGITPARAEHAFETWSAGQWSKLWRACLAANFGSADPGPKSVLASVILAGSAQS